ncbi:MAG: glycerol-3-phosphate 1-O-acyltransferase PlsY [Desulfobacteraceae bacterium]|nr:glycerol-3-phosphate 1-O-acyltransferase PlsY [Desulfobacteraceae bacterium]
MTTSNIIFSHFYFILFAYLTGAIPFGLLVVRFCKGINLRSIGSANIGATNVRRAAGTKIGLIVLACDILKGLVPVAITVFFLNRTNAASLHWLLAAMVLAAVLGHMFPVYLKFRPSGKGVATALGGHLWIAPVASLIALLFFTATVAVSRRVSAGSLVAASILPAAVWLTDHTPAYFFSSLIISILIFIRHAENIMRLYKGTEPTLKPNKLNDE